MYGIDINATKVTQSELVEIIKDLDSRGMVPISITRITKFNTRKPDGFDKFELSGYSGKGGETYFAKVSQAHGNTGIIYEDKVNREREKQGIDTDFEAKKSLYEFITKSVRRKGDQHYLIFYPLTSKEDTTLVGLQDGEFKTVLRESIDQYIPTPSNTSNRQGLAEGSEVKYESISFGSIAAMRVDGVSYIVTDIDEPRRIAFDLTISK